MANMKSLHVALLDADIDPDLWWEAYEGKSDLADFRLADSVYEALSNGQSPGAHEALIIAAGRWPASPTEF